MGTTLDTLPGAWCDSAAVVHILDTLTSKDPIMHLFALMGQTHLGEEKYPS